ncbi:MAG: Gfo/Idh/MocA family oxidoreductase [Bacillota bacterium]
MKKLRVGIVGCGNIFSMHAISIKLNNILELVAVCDNKKERAIDAANKYQAIAYDDYENMLEEANLDAIHICTPHYLHAPMTILAAKHHVHVLTEKPMAIHKSDAKEMIRVCAEQQVFLGVIFQNRYNKGAVFLKERLTSGKLGKIKGAKCQVTWDRSDAYYMQSDWKGTWDKEGGGVVIDQAIHTLDLMRWFIDSKIDYIDATIANRAHEKIDVEDTAEGMIKFKNGIIANFHVINYHIIDSPITIELYCEHGYVKYVDGLTEILYEDGKSEIVGPNPEETVDYGKVKLYWGVSHVKQINDFYQDILNHSKPKIDGQEAFGTQEMINAIYESGKTGKKVFL